MPGIGLDLAHWRRDDGSDAGSSTFRTRLGIGADAPVLLCVAELVARKRHADLLKGFAALVHGGSFAPDRQPVLVLAGDGPLRGPLAAMAAGLGVADHVRWVGFQDDLRPFYQAAAMTVLVSLQEGLPRCLMESLAMETPVVATDVRGNHEIADTSCGRLVPPRNPLALAAAMRELLALKPEERREMGRRGRARMEKYSLARCLEMTEAVYAKVLECGDPAPLCCARPGTRN
jgi:glycosyltransferase involved in cell wall biosynthesis